MSAHSTHLLHPPAMAESAAAKAAGKSTPQREHKQTNMALSKMVGFLRYWSEQAKTVDRCKKNAAKEALEIYRTLSDPATRLSFCRTLSRQEVARMPML